MPRTQTRVEARILCFPKSAIPKQRRMPIHVADILGTMSYLGAGDSRGILPDGGQGTDQSNSADWSLKAFASNDTFETFEKLDYIRFRKDGIVQEAASASSVDNDELSGVILEGRDGFLDCKIGDTPMDNPAVFDQKWEAVTGKWITVQPREAPQRCFIYNKGQDDLAQAKTSGNLPKNRQVRLDLHFLMMKANGKTPAFRFVWGNKYSFVFRHGSKPTIEIFDTATSKWVVLRRLDKAPVIRMNGTSYVVRIRRINGRLVLSINERSYYVVLSQKAANGKPQEIEASWDSAPLGVMCLRCHARIGVALIKYASKPAVNQPEAPHVGSYVRFKPSATPMPSSENGAVVEGYGRGWSGDDTKTKISGVVVAGNPPNGGVRYTATLTANADGIDTPFLSNALLSLSAIWSDPPRPYLDVTPYASKISISLAMPPSSAGAEATVTLNRAHLDEVVGAATAKGYVDSYHPIEIQLRWRYSDGSADPWQRLFKGYIIRPTLGSASGNSQTMTLYCRDSIVRLQKPASIIDAKYIPLDYLFAQNIQQGQSLFGWQCVKEILKTALGTESDSLYTSFPPSHYPLIQCGTGGYLLAQQLVSNIPNIIAGGNLPKNDKFLLPPPFKRYALDWINDIAQFDRAIFFYGWPNGNNSGDWPVPCYGRIKGFLQGRTPKQLYNILNGGDSANRRLLLQADVETRPDRDYNRVWVTGTPPAGLLAQFLPSLNMGDARLPSSDPNSAERTWERTLCISPFGADIPGDANANPAQWIATRAMSEFEGVLLRFPKLVVKFSPDLTWGDIVTPILDSTNCAADKSLDISSREYRVEKVDHQIDLLGKGNSHATTTVHVWPVSASGSF